MCEDSSLIVVVDVDVVAVVPINLMFVCVPSLCSDACQVCDREGRDMMELKEKRKKMMMTDRAETTAS